jgi:hypothetical protein
MIALAAAEKSTRSLLFETEGEHAPEVPYFHSGTCFVGSYRGHGFVLTARHALAWGGDLRAETLRVFAADDMSDMSLPFDMRVDVQGKPGVPDDAADVELLHIAAKLLTDSQAEFVRRIDLDALRPRSMKCQHATGARFVIPGFPFDNKAIEYEKRVIKQRRVVHGGTMTGTVAGGRVHLIDTDDPMAHQSLNGMSGSPVFAVVRSGGEILCPTFDGVLIKGTREGTAAGAFLCAHVIYRVLDQFIETAQ